jgi:hypothetical protein
MVGRLIQVAKSAYQYPLILKQLWHTPLVQNAESGGRLSRPEALHLSSDRRSHWSSRISSRQDRRSSRPYGRRSREIDAPVSLGSARYPVIAKAPGTYVFD